MSNPNRKILYWLIVLLLFLVQGTVYYWIVPESWIGRVNPNLVLAAVLFAALFVHRHFAMVLGLFFGFLHDVMYYGHMLGLYTFVMGLAGYLTGLAFQKKRMPFFYVMTVTGVGCLFFDTAVYLLYRLFQVVDESYRWALTEYILPSLLLNLFFAAALYIPLRRYLEKMTPAEEEEGGA